jgi:hypothetical protein
VRDVGAALGVTSPVLLRLHRDWQERRAGREFPSRSDFDPVDLKYLLGSLSLIEVRHQPLRFRFRLHGSDNVSHVGMDLTGKDLDSFPYDQTRTLIQAHYEAVVVERRPVGRTRNGAFTDGRVWRYEILVLPLSSSGATIDMLMSALVWG